MRKNMKTKNNYYFPRADKVYLTPNEKWLLIKGMLLGINIGFLISIGIILIAKI
jgi:hypothetical protein